jgi:hypothetical protein
MVIDLPLTSTSLILWPFSVVSVNLKVPLDNNSKVPLNTLKYPYAYKCIRGNRSDYIARESRYYKYVF